jgi:hypothetical protein
MYPRRVPFEQLTQAAVILTRHSHQPMFLALVVKAGQVNLLVPLVRAFLHRRQRRQRRPLLRPHLPAFAHRRRSTLVLLLIRRCRHDHPVATAIDP